MNWANTNFKADIVENIGLKLQFQSLFSIRLILQKLIILTQKYYCVTFKSYVLHQF